MATKAELEAELADLKAQLEANSAREEPAATDDPVEAQEAPPAIEVSEDMVKDFVKELQSFATEKPMITLLAAFLIGYVVGRAR